MNKYNKIANETDLPNYSIADVLRKKITDKIAPILRACYNLEDTDLRLNIQTGCLDVVASVEEIIKECRL